MNKIKVIMHPDLVRSAWKAGKIPAGHYHQSDDSQRRILMQFHVEDCEKYEEKYIRDKRDENLIYEEERKFNRAYAKRDSVSITSCYL